MDKVTAFLRLFLAVIATYLYNLLYVLDVLVNAAFGGDHTETISSRMGKGRLAQKPIHTYLANLIDLLFLVLFRQHNHCYRVTNHNAGDYAISEVFARYERGEKPLKL